MSENPTQENPEAQGTEGPANQHGTQPKPPVPPAIAKPEPPPAPDQNKESCHTKKDWLDKTKLGLEILGLAVLVAYTTISALQWYTANSQLDEMRKASARPRCEPHR